MDIESSLSLSLSFSLSLSLSHSYSYVDYIMQRFWSGRNPAGEVSAASGVWLSSFAAVMAVTLAFGLKLWPTGRRHLDHMTDVDRQQALGWKMALT